MAFGFLQSSRHQSQKSKKHLNEDGQTYAKDEILIHFSLLNSSSFFIFDSKKDKTESLLVEEPI